MTPSPPRSIPRPAFEKIELSRMSLPVPAVASTSTPMPALKAIDIAGAGSVPPIVLFDEPPSIRMPSRCPAGLEPVMSVPIRLPSTSSRRWLPATSPTPAPVLPEMMLPAPAAVPPIMTPDGSPTTTP